jgi:Ca2+-binding RTX toxin-like protein
VLRGEQGQDTLVGGSGEDIFRFISGDSDVDEVCDYEDGLDRLNVKDWDVSFNQLDFTQVGSAVLVSGDDAGESFILKDTDQNELSPGDFIV